MKAINYLILLCFFIPSGIFAQQTTWSETFDIPEKGFWGGGSDMSGISKWTLDASACVLASTSDFIKTVTTSDGRMQAVNIDGEAIWNSEIIDISSHSNIGLAVNVSETGTSANTNKYVKVYYSLNGGAETLFESNGQNIGNFTSGLASQTCLNGNTIQIIIRINNPNSGDATIFDNVTVNFDDIAPAVISVIAINESVVKIQFSEQINQAIAENLSNYSIIGIGHPNSSTLGSDKSSVELIFTSNFIENQLYTINISNISDHCGNSISSISRNFNYIPFKPENIYVVSENEILVEFSHFLNKISAETQGNYILNTGIGSPVSAMLESDTLVRLNFAINLTNNSAYTLAINNLTDLNGIALTSAGIPFLFHQVAPFDLVINEIMADPVPSVDLPEYEYFEVFNNTDFTISLVEWKIKIGDVSKSIPLKNLSANSYFIFTSVQGVIPLKNYGETIGILGSSDLTNSGKEIAIISNDGIRIDSLKYYDTWYQNTQKDDGGWSLERIDPNNTCSKSQNWKASINPSGGTPGIFNSVKNANVDNTLPSLISVRTISSNQLMLIFDEEMDITSLSDINNYLLEETIKPINVFVAENNFKNSTLEFETDFINGEHIILIQNLKDLCGNGFSAINKSFIYYPGNEFDIVINEIMADVSPAPNVLPPARYAELFNKTDFDIDITGWSIQIGDNSPIIFPEYIINAQSFLTICSEGQLNNFLSYGNAIGILTESQLTGSGVNISLYNAEGKLIDYVNYSDSWYADGAKSDGGWSLERIDATNYCGDSQNWKASEDYKGGTPGQPNSVNAANPDPSIPFLKQIKVLSSYKLALIFSKNIDQSTAFNTDNYLLNDGSNFLLSIEFADTSRSTIILQYAGQFTDGRPQTIQIQNLSDFCGNVMNDSDTSFTYYLIHPKGVYAESSKILHLIFSEEVEVVTAQIVENYSIANGYGNPVYAYKHSERVNEVYLEFPDEFTNGNTYTLHIENVKDLNGNAIKAVDLHFSYFLPSFNEVVINEVLFNPRPNGFDFVEIYNKSAFELDLSKIQIAGRNDLGEMYQLKQLSVVNQMLKPGLYLAISSDTAQIKKDYPATAYNQFIQIPSLPSYSDDKGRVVLLFGDTILDEFAYNDKMHFALITNTEGISLERIDPEKPTQIATNWYSAAESAGFATPANKNSQFRNKANNSSDELTVDPETFSPNNDGYEDRLMIRYNFEEPGYVANVSIYDGKGLIIKKIAKNELLGVEGEFNWDGLNEDNSKARIGIYIVYFEVFNLKGEVKKYKKACVLAGRLD